MHSVLSMAQGIRFSCGYALYSVFTVTGTVSSIQGFTGKRFRANMQLLSRYTESMVIKYHDRQHEAIQWENRCFCSVFQRVIAISQRALLQPCFSLKFKNGLKQFPAQGHEAHRLTSFKCLHERHISQLRGGKLRERNIHYTWYPVFCDYAWKWARIYKEEKKKGRRIPKNGAVVAVGDNGWLSTNEKYNHTKCHLWCFTLFQ